MADYFNIRAPQWIDFAQNCSPVQIENFFEKEHTVHERIEESENPTAENIENVQPASQMDVLCVNAKAQADLDIIKSTPVKVISPKYRKETVAEVAKVTYDQLFNDAMKKLQLCKKMPKPTLNKSTQEPKIFKTPSMPKMIKSSRSVGCAVNKNTPHIQDSTGKFIKVNKSTFFNLTNNFETINKSSSDDAYKVIYNFKDERNKQCNEENDEEHEEKDNNEEHNEEDNKKHDEDKINNEDDNEKHNKEDDEKLQDKEVKSIDDDKDNKKTGNSKNANAKDDQTQPNKQIAVLTWQNHRRSMHKRKMSVNKPYIGLAEAVARFQNVTPERFHTRSNKENTLNPSFNMSKMTQNRFKPTIPISPALVSKKRIRTVTILTQEERERMEIEQMKRLQIKANPIPPNVLRGPRVMPTRTNSMEKKPMVNTNISSAMQPDEKTKSLQKSKSPHRDKLPSNLKNTVAHVVMTDSEGIIVEHEEMAFFGVPKNTTKNVTRVMPFSFEARNKDLQMKKEQRLKSLQEASKSKAEFHARPAPNFPKPSTSNSTKLPIPSAKQQQNARKVILPIPFSFEERNRRLLEKKQQLMKQELEESKRSRVFRANPAPVFKPVMIRGKSKEYLFLKNKSEKMECEHNVEYKCEDQENKELNEIDTCKMEEDKYTQKSFACNDDNSKVPLKAPLELNTDKRAKERHEFNEKLKRKEMEEETKRQEQEKQQLEHEKQLKAELRKQAEVKAKPMPKYKLPIITKAMKPLTNPQSPAFASKLRYKQTEK